MSWIPTAWGFAFFVRWILRTRDWAIVNWVFFELRPFIPAAAIGIYLLGAAAEGTDGMGWRIFTLACTVFNWWFSRHDKDDDDRWKRRRDKAAAVIAAIGGRLHVIPAGAR